MRITVDEISYRVAEICQKYATVLAAVLMGSCARNEETYFVNCIGQREMMSDYEMLIIVKCHSDMDAISDSLCRLRDELIKDRHSDNFDLEWMFKTVEEIRRIDKRFIFFETRFYSRLVYGDAKILNEFPKINISNLNYSELNTVIIHRLYHVIRCMNSEDEHFKKYLIARNTLDFSTAFLPLVGILIPSYSARTMELEKIAESHMLPQELVNRQHDYLIMKKDYDAEQYNDYSYEIMLQKFYEDFMLLKFLQCRYQRGVLFRSNIRNMLSAIYRFDIRRMIICLKWGKLLTSLCDEMFDLIKNGKVDEIELNNLKKMMKELFNYC